MAVDFYKEVTPLPSLDYFSTVCEAGNEQPSSQIATVTVFYNEDGYTMEKTLKSLDCQQSVSTLGHDLLIVGDGLQQMSSTMAQYLSKVFQGVTLPTSIDEWPGWANTCIAKIGRHIDYWRHGRLCLVLKKSNKGKWNSHEWHMRSFAKDAKYCFLTDVGCQYNPHLITNFIKHFQLHESCVAVTGRRVAQTEFQQCDPCLSRQDTLMQYILRACQSKMFEIENNSKIENVFGCIPLLHGHCTFYHWSKVMQKPSFIDLYFDLAYKSPADIGILKAQLRLSEDTVQAMYLLTYVPLAETMVVEDALFYFDVELTWEKFAKQRRRWDNSHLATALHLLNSSRKSSIPLWKKIVLWICMIRWMITLVSSKLMISVHAMISFMCYLVLFQVFLSKELSFILCCALLFSYLVAYIGFVVAHAKRFGRSDCSFHGPMWVAACSLSVFVQLTIISLIPLYFLVDLSSDAVRLVQTILTVEFLSNILPWLRTLYVDGKRVIHILCSIPKLISMFLMEPAVYGFMPAYHLARAMDLSWGNRPGLDMQLHNEQDVENANKCSIENCPQSIQAGNTSICKDHAWMKNGISKWKLINAAFVCCNIGLSSLIVFTPYAMEIMIVLCIAANLHYVLMPLMIVADIIKGISRLASAVFRRCRFHQISKREVTVICNGITEMNDV